MDKYNPREWFSLIFSLQSDDTLKKTFPHLIGIAIFSFGITYFQIDYLKLTKESQFSELKLMHNLLGLILSLLMVFRTNSAYDRWWEGRKLWGSLVNSSRNLAIKVSQFIPKDDIKNRKFFQNMIPNFAFSLVYHLRDQNILVGEKKLQSDLQDIDSQILDLQNKTLNLNPMFISKFIFERIDSLHRAGTISGDKFLLLREDLNSFVDILGGCDRIKTSPIPHSYSSFIKKFIFLYTSTIPVTHAVILSYWSIFVSVFCLYVIMSLELLAEEIEDPFGLDDNDLPTPEISNKIKTSVDEIFNY
jgi:ion channel-forming bestrophin family protein